MELQPIDLRLLGVLGARDGRAKPAELREATGIPPRTLSRALTRLDDAGLLEERSKATVTLSAAGWCLLQPALEVHHKGPQSTRPAPARPPGPDEELGDEDELLGELDVDQEPDEHELLAIEQEQPEHAGGFLAGLREA